MSDFIKDALISALVTKSIKDSGKQVVSYSELSDKPKIDGITLNGDQTSLDLGLSVSIQTTNNLTIEGYLVPNLTPEQITLAYNSVVAGKSTTITDAYGMVHFVVNQADNMDVPSISFDYFDKMILTYFQDGTVEHVKIGDRPWRVAWNNPNPQNDFVEGAILANLTNATEVQFVFNRRTNLPDYKYYSEIVPMAKNVSSVVSIFDFDSNSVVSRNIQINTLGNGGIVAISKRNSTLTNVCIPAQILVR